MNGGGVIKGTFKSIKQNISKVKEKVQSKITPTKSEKSGDESPPEKNFDIISLPKTEGTAKEEDIKEEVDNQLYFYTSLSESIMNEIRPSLEDKIVSEDYFSNGNAKKSKRSTSTSRVKEEEEYEEVSDLNYILTEAEWRAFLKNPPKKPSETLQQRII